MTRSERDIFDRLGPHGLVRVVDDLLDQGRLVRLANACGLGYPGMRTQSQPRERLLRDLVDKAAKDDAARRAILKTLHKETSGSARGWSRMTVLEKTSRLTGNGAEASGLHLFLAAADGSDPAVDTALNAALGSPVTVPSAEGNGHSAVTGVEESAPPARDPAREAARLEKKNAELQKKMQYLEGQIARAREQDKALKRDLLQRKGELAESRMLVERLGREMQELRQTTRGAAQPSKASSPGNEPEGTGEGVKTLRKLAAEQRKLAHAIEKLVTSPPVPALLEPSAMAPVVDLLEDLRREASALRRDRKKEVQAHAQQMEELRAELRGVRELTETGPARSRSGARRKGEPERVGVFVDVQNVYYGARQLKGKLDFDALLEAASANRRLIQAIAYVVESKEIDQSGFIAMLQQRGIEVRRKALKVRSDGSMKGDWDMEMALDILDGAPRLDIVVLVSGDGDFTSLVKRVKGMGPKVEVIAFPRNTAKSLLEAADHYQPLDRKFMIRSEPPRAESAPPYAPPAPPATIEQASPAESPAPASSGPKA